MANFLVDHEYTLDITPSARPQLVPVSEYDVGRIFSFTITKDGEEMQNLTSALGAVTVEGTIGSYAFSEPASIENGKIVFQLTESMTAHAGKAWTKIKFANADAPISTCAFFLAVDRAGVEADTVIGAPGFQEQINQGVAEYFDNDPPFFELPSGGQSGQALLSDGADGAYWGEAGIPEAVKAALLACFRGVAWLNDNDFSDKYTALVDALYPDTPTPPSYLTGYTIVGNPTIDSQYRMTTSDGNFIKTPFNFDNGGAPWELRGKVNFSEANHPWGDTKWYDIANCVDSNNNSVRGLLIELSRSSTHGAGDFINRFNIFASNELASWNIVSPQFESVLVTSLINGDFYFKAGWTGSAYYIAASADGVTWSNELRHEWQSATPIMTGYPIAFGNKRNLAWGYCIYVNSLELDIDGSLYWKAVG